MSEERIDPQTIAWREAKHRLVVDGCTLPDYSGLQIEVMSLRMAEKYVPGEDEVCISFYSYEHKDWGGTSRPGDLSLNFVEILYMQLDDVPDMKQNDPRFIGATEMTEAQADEIAKFAIFHRNRKKFVIHCYMGASRSRSTAAAIVDVFQLPYSFTVLNSRVFNYVKNALKENLATG